MFSVVRKKYALGLNERAGTVDVLHEPGDSPDITLTHRDRFAAFGSLSVTPRGVPWELKDNGSPLGVKSYVFQERRLFAQFREGDAGHAVFENSVTGHRVEYRFEDDSFSVRWHGEFPEADQIAVDLNPAFLDLRQNEPKEDQFTFQSFYADEQRELGYAYFSRVGGGGHGMLIYAPSQCAGWRLRYGASPDIHGFQLIRRFSEQIDPAADLLPLLDFSVNVSFHDSLDDALAHLAEKEDLPLLSAPVKAAYPGEPLKFAVRGTAEISLISPDGSERMIPAENGLGQVVLESEGFYRLAARNASGKYYELVLHCVLPPLTLLKRSRAHMTPFFRSFNAENQAWVQGMLQAHRLLGPDERMNGYLHDFLSLIGQQGRPDNFPGKIPPPEESLIHLERRCPEREHYTKIDGLFRGAPSPCPFEFDGMQFPAGHIWKWHRIQDGFAFVQTYLYAAQAYHYEPYYEYALELARAHIHSHQREDGAIVKYSQWEKCMVDYSTVISPLLSLAELYDEMKIRNDARREEIAESCIRLTEYLLKRGMEFPTEGIPVHLRWTEDGAISCTALSLLACYTSIRADRRYLDFAEEVLRFHESWHIRTNDVRSSDATFRFWETQWENEGEGHSVNCGHAWNLWRGEAMFYLGAAKHDPKAFLESWNTFQTVLCNQHPDGSVSSCFTPDYLPERPRRLELYHRYPASVGGGVLASYVWPRLVRTWFRSGVVFEDPVSGVLTLNGRLADDGKFIPYAPEFRTLYDFRNREKPHVCGK